MMTMCRRNPGKMPRSKVGILNSRSYKVFQALIVARFLYTFILTYVQLYSIVFFIFAPLRSLALFLSGVSRLSRFLVLHAFLSPFR